MGRAIVRAARRVGPTLASSPASRPRERRDRQGCRRARRRRPRAASRSASDLRAALAQCDVAIDFSNAAATAANARRVPRGAQAARHRHHRLRAQMPARDRRQPRATSPVLVAPNTSLGVTLLIELVRAAAKALPAGLRHRDQRSASPQQEGCALGHRARARSSGRGRAGRRSSREVGVDARSWRQPARGRARSASPSSGAGTSSGEHTVLFAGRGRAADARSPGDGPVDLCPGRPPSGSVAGRPAGGPLRHARRCWL